MSEPATFLWWLSFLDRTRPEGEQFVGAVIAEGDSLEEIVIETYERGCNPGGEVLSVGPISSWWANTPAEFKAAPRWVLMNVETMERLGLDPVGLGQ